MHAYLIDSENTCYENSEFPRKRKQISIDRFRKIFLTVNSLGDAPSIGDKFCEQDLFAVHHPLV